MREVYMEEKQYSLPSPIVNKKESDALVALTEKYEKMTTPGKLSKAGKKVVEIIPGPVKKVAKAAKDGITEAELFAQCMKVVAEGYYVAPSRFGNDKKKTGFSLQGNSSIVIMKELVDKAVNKNNGYIIKLSRPKLWLLEL